MKYTTLAAFEKHLNASFPNHFSSVYLIMAKDPFTRKQAGELLTRYVLKEESPSLSLHQYDAAKHSLHEIIQELEALSFFSKQRLIVVHHADLFDKASTVRLEKYYQTASPAACLVLMTEGLARTTTFYKKTEKAGVVLEVEEERPWEKEKTVASWLPGEAMRQGKRISPQACQLLIRQVGLSQATLLCELQKLACYVGEKEAIEERDIAALCISVNIENVWQLGEALFRRDCVAALRISKALLADGASLFALLKQVRAQFQIEYQVCSIIANGGTESDITQKFPYMKGGILQRHIQQATGYGMQRFKRAIIAIDEGEVQAKNSSTKSEWLLERLMIRLAGQ